MINKPRLLELSPHTYTLIDTLPELSTEEAEAARNELLETRGQYLIRNKVVESVLSANPILKAVHSGTDASPVERCVLAALY